MLGVMQLFCKNLEKAAVGADDDDGDVDCDDDDDHFDGDDDVDVQEGGGTQDFTTITWQIGLGETLCYRFH